MSCKHTNFDYVGVPSPAEIFINGLKKYYVFFLKLSNLVCYMKPSIFLFMPVIKLKNHGFFIIWPWKTIVSRNHVFFKTMKWSNLHSLRMQVKPLFFFHGFSNPWFVFHHMSGRQTLFFFIASLFWQRVNMAWGEEFIIPLNQHYHHYLLLQTTSGNNVCCIKIIYKHSQCSEKHGS